MLELDRALFHFINTGLANEVFDALLPIFREKRAWIGAYILLLLFFLIRNYRTALFVLVFGIASVGISDSLTSKVIKPAVGRIRPCKTEPESVRLLVPCGSGKSFPSSHAANHFAIAVFLFGVLRRWGYRPYWLLIWAALVAFAQVYVGVHYPLDVLAGAGLGALFGSMLFWLFRRLSEIGA